jgi:hypothetical protein
MLQSWARDANRRTLALCLASAAFVPPAKGDRRFLANPRNTWTKSQLDMDPLTMEKAQEQERRADEASGEFLLSWNRLVSTTNWQKGRIIGQWRQTLIDLAASPASYSDEAWSRRVGGVTPQHVGRLRRVWQRFGETHGQYDGLYWSHFQAALDWDDAEMWLEGAVQNGWSVAQMRRQRWETLGGPAEEPPRDEDIVAAELDEDFSFDPEDDSAGMTLSDTPTAVRGTGEAAALDSGHVAVGDGPETADAVDFIGSDATVDESVKPEPVRPFEGLTPLPDDLAEAVETLKLAIVRHKLSGWRDVHCDDVLAALSALKQLALAPPEG